MIKYSLLDEFISIVAAAKMKIKSIATLAFPQYNFGLSGWVAEAFPRDFDDI
jgi:hypothetical protein